MRLRRRCLNPCVNSPPRSCPVGLRLSCPLNHRCSGTSGRHTARLRCGCLRTRSHWNFSRRPVRSPSRLQIAQATPRPCRCRWQQRRWEMMLRCTSTGDLPVVITMRRGGVSVPHPPPSWVPLGLPTGGCSGVSGQGGSRGSSSLECWGRFSSHDTVFGSRVDRRARHFCLLPDCVEGGSKVQTVPHYSFTSLSHHAHSPSVR